VRHLLLFATAAVLPLQAVSAAETIAYSYDAKGRLMKVVRSGSVNNGVTTTYTHDRVDNRKTLVVTGSPNPPPQ
jgi:hypothetical protein